MSQTRKVSTLVIHACPEQLTSAVGEILRVYCVEPNWTRQELLPGCLRTEVILRITEVESQELVCKLNEFAGLYLDLFTPKHLFMLVPGLGIYSAEINQAGEVVISESRLNRAIECAAGNHKELTRLIRLALGQSWDDLLEPFRASKHGAEIVLLHRAG